MMLNSFSLNSRCLALFPSVTFATVIQMISSGVLKSLIRYQRFSLDLKAPGKVKVLVVRLTEDDVVGSVASKGAEHSRWVSQRGEHPAGALS